MVHLMNLWGYWYFLSNKGGAEFPLIRGMEKPKLLH